MYDLKSHDAAVDRTILDVSRSYSMRENNHIRNMIFALGESYRQVHDENPRSYGSKRIGLLHWGIGLLGLIFIILGQWLFENPNIHLSLKFVGFSIFGVGILTALFLPVHIITIICGVISRYLNKKRLEKLK